MRGTEKLIAICSRKSKFTGKGESIGTQVELRRKYKKKRNNQIRGCGILPQPLIFCAVLVNRGRLWYDFP